MPEPVLDRRTLNRTLLARQGLLRRERRRVADAIEHLVGMQSQVPSQPFVALWSRLESFDPGELDALMVDRSAVRIGLMRTTIHLVSARDALALAPAFADVQARVLQSQRIFREPLAGLDLDEVAELGARLISDKPMTAAALRQLLQERWPDRDPAALVAAVRYLVPVIQVPPRGLWRRSMQPTITTLDAWLEAPVPREVDLETILVRYLRAFGPASVADMRTWSWITGLREVVERLRPQLRTYRDESGRELFDVEGAPLVAADVPAPPRFLPEYDNAFLSHEDRSRIGGPWYDQDRLSRARGKLLVDGFIAGGWWIEEKRRTARLFVELFADLAPADRSAVEAEADALLRFTAPDAEDLAVEVRRVEVRRVE